MGREARVTDGPPALHELGVLLQGARIARAVQQRLDVHAVNGLTGVVDDQRQRPAPVTVACENAVAAVGVWALCS